MRVEKRGVARGDHDVGVGDEVEPTAGDGAVDRRDHRLPDLELPRGEGELGVARAARLLAQRGGVTTQLGDVEAGLERLALPRVHDHPHRRIGVELVPRRLELVHHRVVHRVADLRPVEDQPADRALPLDEQRVVRQPLVLTGP